MSTINNLTGGAFQDVNGNVLADGYLLVKLSQDGIVNTSTQVCSEYEINIPLDSSGNVASGALWPNDLMIPSGTFYTIRAYTAQGQLAFGPIYTQILSTPSPFNLGAIIPGDL